MAVSYRSGSPRKWIGVILSSAALFDFRTRRYSGAFGGEALVGKLRIGILEIS
jgi:hypothetical protein